MYSSPIVSGLKPFFSDYELKKDWKGEKILQKRFIEKGMAKIKGSAVNKRVKSKNYTSNNFDDKTRNREYNFNEEDLSKTFKLSAKGTKRLFSALKNTATRDKIEECLELANKLIKGHGILRIRLDDMNINILYINRRNIYKKTIIYDEGKKKFIIASWCDWFDEWESVNLNNIFS